MHLVYLSSMGVSETVAALTSQSELVKIIEHFFAMMTWALEHGNFWLGTEDDWENPLCQTGFLHRITRVR